MSEKQITQRVPESARSQEEDTIDLVELACALLDKWAILLAAAVSCALIAAIVVNFFVVPKYKATATLYVISRKDSAINISDLQIGTELTSDFKSGSAVFLWAAGLHGLCDQCVRYPPAGYFGHV